MRRLSVLLVILLAGPAFAGSYTVTTTPEQDEALKVLSARFVSNPKPAPQQLIQELVNRYTANTVEDIKRTADRAAACAKVTDAQVKQHLGCSTK